MPAAPPPHPDARPATASELDTRVAFLQRQLAAEADSYRMIIATLAGTCRTLQARVRALEAHAAEQASLDDGPRALQRRTTWHGGARTGATSPRLGLPREAGRRPALGLADDTLCSEDDGKAPVAEGLWRVVYDDAALFRTACAQWLL